MHSSSSRTPNFLAGLLGLALVVGAPLGARAADEGSNAGTGVARISIIGGSVAVQRGDATSPTAAVINAPVLGGDYVTTGDASRTEIQLDATSALRLSSNVQMRFTHLDTTNREVALAEGALELSLLRAPDGRVQIDTPSVSVAPRMAGSYRVSVGSDGRTHVTVRSGRADVLSPQLVQALLPGTTLVASGSASGPSIASEAAVAYDDFDRFNDERDRGEARALANAVYTAPGVAGIGDLDTYGRWVTDAPYGRVWVPYATSADWAPYRDGRWVWEDSFGWTWIGYEPWGWAPYHYGRWYHHAHYGWCWYPQRAFVAWRPALVGFFTFGSGGFGQGFGNMAWVPLAPYEPYYPWWGPGYGSPTIVNNVTYVTNNYYSHFNRGQFTRHYGNARYNGVTYLPHRRFAEGTFERGRPIASAQLRSIEVVRGPLQVVPTAEHLRFSDRPVAMDLAVKPALLHRTFAGEAPPVIRVPFVQQRAAVAQVTHAAIGARDVPGHRTVEVIEGTTVTHPAANDPWSRFGASRGVPAGARAVTAPPATSTEPVHVMPPAHPASAWSRYDAAAPSGHAATRSYDAVRTNDVPRAIDVPRTREAPVHRTLPAEQARVYQPQRSYDAPHPEQRAVPAAQPQHTAPSHTERTHSEHHQPH
jgi:hypothetical protein